ncbi:uncharacterized protein B0H64DRAFT_147946 [Chaetomium fimeti]|uniref:Uncharacterized protein n=1 Tax=Chaetomium fimeti TaxID=1854472 RepID=A0AAE0LS58_9PEZI|nr:hypothetical protein B0H64DRAFT_147946 [Chaetomium fimeti]
MKDITTQPRQLFPPTQDDQPLQCQHHFAPRPPVSQRGTGAGTEGGTIHLGAEITGTAGRPDRFSGAYLTRARLARPKNGTGGTRDTPCHRVGSGSMSISARAAQQYLPYIHSGRVSLTGLGFNTVTTNQYLFIIRNRAGRGGGLSTEGPTSREKEKKENLGFACCSSGYGSDSSVAELLEPGPVLTKAERECYLAYQVGQFLRVSYINHPSCLVYTACGMHLVSRAPPILGSWLAICRCRCRCRCPASACPLCSRPAPWGPCPCPCPGPGP